MDDNYYIKLLKSGQKFFNLNDLQAILNLTDRVQINNIVNYYKSKNKIFSIKRGLYSIIPLDKITFEDKLIIAQKIITPSYITYHTALSINGINFQFYNSIHLFADYHKKIIILGLINVKTDNGYYTISNIERSVIDTWYINSNIGIDNLKGKKYDKKLLFKIAKIYNKPSIYKNLKIYFNI